MGNNLVFFPGCPLEAANAFVFVGSAHVSGKWYGMVENEIAKEWWIFWTVQTKVLPVAVEMIGKDRQGFLGERDELRCPCELGILVEKKGFVRP